VPGGAAQATSAANGVARNMLYVRTVRLARLGEHPCRRIVPPPMDHWCPRPYHWYGRRHAVHRLCCDMARLAEKGLAGRAGERMSMLPDAVRSGVARRTAPVLHSPPCFVPIDQGQGGRGELEPVAGGLVRLSRNSRCAATRTLLGERTLGDGEWRRSLISEIIPPGSANSRSRR
jgi:hypothetical protein